ncbi:MAG TPA: DNA-3-methyladenine glycosylase [Actinotalea sp.]
MSSPAAPPPAASSRDVLARRVLDVAPALLGCHVTTVLDGGTVTARITEVEAYDGAADPGSHAFRGRTPRNAVMFGPPGHLYVYRHLGLHFCANVVTGAEGSASAVLLRAGEIVEGRELARARRLERGVVRTDADLARGPARLAAALGLDLTVAGADLLAATSTVRLVLPPTIPVRYATGPRVGVAGLGGDADRFPWRFWLVGEETVSAYRRAAAPRVRERRGTSRSDAAPPDPRGTAH